MICWQQLSSYDLSHQDIHLWFINVSDHQVNLFSYQNLLSNEEWARANRFKFDKDRNCFIISRAVLKILLSRYLNCSPHDVTFQLNQYGKPFVILPDREVSIHFNLSHSHYRTLIAVAKNQNLGVDIEYMQEKLNMQAIVERCFSFNEFEEFKQLPENQKIQGFYNIWTRKEAFTKAIGQGILYPLNQFEVSVNPDHKARIIAIDGDRMKAKYWHLYGFTPEEQYCAALSWRGNKKELIFFKF